MNSSKISASILALALGFNVHAAPNVGEAPAPKAIAFDAAKGKIEFTALGQPKLLKIVGQAEGLEGDLKTDNGKVSGEFRLHLSKLATGIDSRDRHMKEKYLEVEKHPKAILRLKDLSMDGLSSTVVAIKDRAFEGELELHGVKQPVKGVFDLEGKSGAAVLKARFETKVSAYKIPVPSFAGVTVADQVNVQVEVPGVGW